jgi:hypothetical protein
MLFVSGKHLEKSVLLEAVRVYQCSVKVKNDYLYCHEKIPLYADCIFSAWERLSSRDEISQAVLLIAAGKPLPRLLSASVE